MAIVMEIREMQKQYIELVDGFNIKENYRKDKRDMMLHLVEEVGELAGEANKEYMYWKKDFDKNKFSGELVDVLGILLQIADRYDVDVDEVFKEKMVNWEERFGSK